MVVAADSFMPSNALLIVPIQVMLIVVVVHILVPNVILAIQMPVAVTLVLGALPVVLLVVFTVT